MGKAVVFQSLVVILNLSLAVILISRRTHNQFPFFGLYAYSAVLIEIIRLSVLRQYQTFFKIYWLTEAIYAVFSLLALHEIFRRVFMAFYVELWFKLLFPIVVILAALVTILEAIYHPPFEASRIIALILLFGMAMSFMKTGMFCLFMTIASVLRLRWRFAPLGVALGFAASGTGGLIAYWARSEIGTTVALLAQYVAYGFNILAILVWLDTFLRPEPEPQWSSSVTPRLLIEAIRRETESLRKLIGK
jgi:hypothetical protein